jgi:integrase
MSKRKKYAVAGLDRHGSKWRWRRMVGGRLISHTFAAASEAEAVAMAMDLAGRPEVRAAGAWEFEARRYVSGQVAAGGLSRNYGRERLRVLLTEGERMGVEKPAELTLARAQAWYDERTGSGERKIGSVNHYVLHLMGMEKFLAEEGKCLDGVMGRVRTLEAEDNVREVWLTAEEVGRILGVARAKFENRGKRWEREGWPYEELWILLAAECGMRGGEIDAARSEWVDLERGVMVVPVEDDYDESRTWRRKGKRGVRRAAMIPLSARVRGFFEEWGVGEPYLLNPEGVWGRGAYRVERGKRMRQFLNGCGLGEVTGHDLRRSFGSNRVGAGVPMEKVANWMGISLKVAWERYARFVPDDGAIEAGTAVSAEAEAPAPADAGVMRPVKERLQELGELLESGLISEEEFAAKRAGILEGI